MWHSRILNAPNTIADVGLGLPGDAVVAVPVRVGAVIFVAAHEEDGC